MNDDAEPIIPENIKRDIADLVVSGKEFNVGRLRFKVKRIYRGSMANVNGEVVPIVRKTPRGWRLGFYEDPDRVPSAPLLVAFELERIR